VEERVRAKDVCAKVVKRLQCFVLVVSFQCWFDFVVHIKHEKALDVQKKNAELAASSKAERIRRALFARGSRICDLTIRWVSCSFNLRVLRRWRLHVRLLRALYKSGVMESMRFFLLWRAAIPQLRLERQSAEIPAAKKPISAKFWR
jgi:hypothetical protein